jgi:hypothetical protein
MQMYPLTTLTAGYKTPTRTPPDLNPISQLQAFTQPQLELFAVTTLALESLSGRQHERQSILISKRSLPLPTDRWASVNPGKDTKRIPPHGQPARVHYHLVWGGYSCNKLRQWHMCKADVLRLAHSWLRTPTRVCHCLLCCKDTTITMVKG